MNGILHRQLSRIVSSAVRLTLFLLLSTIVNSLHLPSRSLLLLAKYTLSDRRTAQKSQLSMAAPPPKEPTATHKEVLKAASKPKTLLALDGGGVKGISTLILLQAIMDEVKKQEGGEGDERKPVDYFDLAAGTSTGGLIALMLFRLHMSTSQVMEVYNSRAKDIFSPTFLGIPLDKVPLGHWLGFTILLKIKTLFT